MSMLNEMFGDSSPEQIPSTSTLLAEGNYVGDTDTILSGYKTFRNKYVYKSLILKLIVVLVALASSIMMLITSESGDIMPIFCLLVCIAAGIYFVNEPIKNKKKLKVALESLQGTEYNSQIFTDKIVISTIFDDNVENSENTDEDNDNTSEDNAINENDIVDDDMETEDNQIPATVIHLDSPIVDFLDRNDMFILVVKKSYVFIIPKSAFTKEEITAVQDKFKLILGIRYKVV